MKLLGAWLCVFLIGFAGLAVLAWGWIGWLPIAMQLGEDYGPEWAWAGLAVGGAGTVGVAMALWRVQDALSRRLDPNAAAGDSIVESLFCPTCGLFKPATLKADRCPACGARFLR